MTVPAEFNAKIRDTNNKWFIMNNVDFNSDNVSVSETKILVNSVDSNNITVGIKQDKYTMVYKTIASMTYVQATGSLTDYFVITVEGGGTYKLFTSNGQEHNIGQELVTNKIEKMVHLIKGVPGEKGENGKNGLSSYELWSKKYPGISQEVFIRNLNNAYTYGAQVELALQEIATMKEKMNAMQVELAKKNSEIPIGALMYSHNNPNPNCWLPFGFNNNVYLDADYPELSRIVKSWGNSFVVDDHRFRLGNSSDINRYIYCAGGNRPAGTLTSSQLPNITGNFNSGDNNSQANGCFVITGWTNWTGDGRNSMPWINFDASRSSAIYKNNVTQVFGDSISMNAFIKAKN